MVTTAAARRLDDGRHRGRGAAAGVLLDQGVRPALQREVPRRQVLPLPRGHPQRGVPAGHRHARREAHGRALLRAVRARLGHPRDRRPADAGLPDADRAAPASSSGHGQMGRPCLLGYIGKCSAPCVGRVSAPRSTARSPRTSATSWPGRRPRSSAGSRQQMQAAAAELDFEQAARLRDDLRALERALEKSAVVLGDGTDADVLGVADDTLEAARPGVPRPRRAHPRPARLGRRQGRGRSPRRARRPAPRAAVRRRRRATESRARCWCRRCRPTPAPSRSGSAGCAARRVDLRVPQRGDKRA